MYRFPNRVDPDRTATASTHSSYNMNQLMKKAMFFLHSRIRTLVNFHSRRIICLREKSFNCKIMLFDHFRYVHLTNCLEVTHMQTVQNQVRRHRMLCLTRLYILCFYNVLLKVSFRRNVPFVYGKLISLP